MWIGYSVLLRLACVILLYSATLVVVLEAARVPGVKWGALEVWENSASIEVWSLVAEYLSFRKYALDRLSDAGFLDHLIDDYGDPLRLIEGIGGVTGIVVAVRTIARRVRQSADRQIAQDGDESKDDEDDSSWDLPGIRTTSFAMVQQMLREGPIMRVFRQAVGVVGSRTVIGNVFGSFCFVG